MTLLDTALHIFMYFYIYIGLPVGFLVSIWYLLYHRPFWYLLLSGVAGAYLVPAICDLWWLGYMTAICLGLELGIAYGACLQGSTQRRLGAFCGWLISLLVLGYEYYSKDTLFWQPELLGHEGIEAARVAMRLVYLEIILVGIVGALIGSGIGSGIGAWIGARRVSGDVTKK